jgi:hypothetical protein
MDAAVPSYPFPLNLAFTVICSELYPSQINKLKLFTLIIIFS